MPLFAFLLYCYDFSPLRWCHHVIPYSVFGIVLWLHSCCFFVPFILLRTPVYIKREAIFFLLAFFLLTCHQTRSACLSFVTGATGYIGAGVVRGLIKKAVQTTAYVRDEKKVKDLFKDELKTGYLTIVVGTYSSVNICTEAIQWHTRLFLLVVTFLNQHQWVKSREHLAKLLSSKMSVKWLISLQLLSVLATNKV